MKAFFFSLAAGIAACMTACQQPSSNSSQPAADTVVVADTIPIRIGPQCFMQVVGRDTARLLFEVIDDSVSGKLSYHRYEKDSNAGDITGHMQGNIIDAVYRFTSEGMVSTNQVVFKVEGGQVYEGRASEFDKEGRPVFDKDLGKVQFDSVAFVEGTCW